MRNNPATASYVITQLPRNYSTATANYLCHESARQSSLFHWRRCRQPSEDQSCQPVQSSWPCQQPYQRVVLADVPLHSSGTAESLAEQADPVEGASTVFAIASRNLWSSVEGSGARSALPLAPVYSSATAESPAEPADPVEGAGSVTGILFKAYWNLWNSRSRPANIVSSTAVSWSMFSIW